MQERRQVPHSHHKIKKVVIGLMALFAIGYMVSQPNMDGYNLSEAFEYVLKINSVVVLAVGFATSLLAIIPQIAAILYLWAKGDHHHHHSSVWHQLLEIFCIALPFALMGCAAYLDSFSKLFTKTSLSVTEYAFKFLGAGLSSAVVGLGAYKMHGFHVHQAMNKNGGGFKGFLIGLYTTFILNVWNAKNDKTTLWGKFTAVFFEAWIKYGIVIGHGLLGYYASNVFLKETTLNRIKGLKTGLNIFVPSMITVFESHTEASSLDAVKIGRSYVFWSWLVVGLAALFHSIEILTSGTQLLHPNNDQGPWDGKLFNILYFLLVTIIFLPPNIRGVTATMIRGYDKAVREVKNKIQRCGRLPSGNEHFIEIQDNPTPKQNSCAKLLSCFGVLKNRENNQETLEILQSNGLALGASPV